MSYRLHATKYDHDVDHALQGMDMTQILCHKVWTLDWSHATKLSYSTVVFEIVALVIEWLRVLTY